MPIHNTHLDIDIPTGTEIYNALMAKIEPELLLENLPHLDEAYTTETPEQKKERYARYKQAFAAYDRAYAQWKTALERAHIALQRKILLRAEQNDEKNDQAQLAEIDAELSSEPS